MAKIEFKFDKIMRKNEKFKVFTKQFIGHFVEIIPHSPT